MIDSKSLKQITKDLSVLYVEDDLKIQNSMTRYLEKFFTHVESCNNGKEGLELYKKRKFDIVITDISMPQMNGIEMIELMKQQNDAQSFIITTAHYEPSYMLSAIKDGVDGYVIKPFDYEQLKHELFKVAQKIVMASENEAYKNHLSMLVDEKNHELQELLEFQSENYEQTLLSMIEMIEQRDTYTAGHSKRVAEYSKNIAKAMGYSQEECIHIYQAGILHDVGKIGTPDAVLLNPKSLNDLEYKLIQGHVKNSYKLLKSIPMFHSMAEIVYSHHERYDGKGYPRALSADEIPELARIIIIADSFDAMTTNRIYKARKSVKEAVEEIRKFSGAQFDPKVVEVAVKVLGEVVIDESVNQLPQTKLEEERFAYFYKDSITEAYNQNYLDVVLIKNMQQLFFRYMYVISLKKFSAYNKQYGWKSGDELLSLFADTLIEHCDEAYVFRIFGDDFVLLSNQESKVQIIQKILQESVGTQIYYTITAIDLQINPLSNITQIEAIC